MFIHPEIPNIVYPDYVRSCKLSNNKYTFVNVESLLTSNEFISRNKRIRDSNSDGKLTWYFNKFVIPNLEFEVLQEVPFIIPEEYELNNNYLIYVDYLIPSKNLVIEVDDKYHTSEYEVSIDKLRDKLLLELYGLSTLRLYTTSNSLKYKDKFDKQINKISNYPTISNKFTINYNLSPFKNSRCLTNHEKFLFEHKYKLNEFNYLLEYYRFKGYNFNERVVLSESTARNLFSYYGDQPRNYLTKIINSVNFYLKLNLSLETTNFDREKFMSNLSRLNDYFNGKLFTSNDTLYIRRLDFTKLVGLHSSCSIEAIDRIQCLLYRNFDTLLVVHINDNDKLPKEIRIKSILRI